MADGTNVGGVYLDLVVRDTIAQQVQNLASKAEAASRRQFADVGKAAGDAMTRGMTDAARAMTNTMQQSAASAQRVATGMVNGVFSKSVALIQAKIRELETSFDRMSTEMDAMWSRGIRPGNAAFDKLANQQQRLSDRIAAMNERLTIEIQAQAQKQAAAKQAAYAKAARAAESAAKRELAAARQAHTIAAPPSASRKINTDNAVRQTGAEESGEQLLASYADGMQIGSLREKLRQFNEAATGSFAQASQAASESAEKTQSIWSRAVAKIGSGIRSGLGRSLSSLWGTARAVLGKVGGLLAGLTKKLLPFRSGIRQAGSGMQSLGVRLGSIVSGALVFNVISSGLTRMVSAMGTALTGTSQMQAALSNLKGAAATAAAPLIQTLTPALSALANAAATVFSYLSQLISFFTGKSVSAMASAARGMSGVGSAASGTAKQVKEASKSLAGFDEIEKLSAPEEEDGGSGGGGASSLLPNYNFQGKSPFLDSILGAVKAGQWEQVGALVAEKLNGAMAAIPWEKIDKTVSGWASNLARTLNGAVGALDWPLVGQTVANGLNVGLHAVDTFMDTFHWTALGSGIANGLNGAVAALDWASLGRFLTDKMRAAFEFLHGFVQDFDFAALGTSLATAVSAAFQNVDWVQAFGDGSAFLVGALQTLTAWVQGIDWAAVGTTIADCLMAVDWAGILLNLLLFIGEALSGMTQVLTSFFTELADACGDGFLGGILRFFADIATWVRENMIDPLVDAVKNLLGIHSPSTVFAEIGQNLVLGLFNGISAIWSKITDFFSTALDGIRKRFADTWQAVRDNVTNTFTAVRSTMTTIWNGITETVRGAVNAVIGFMNRLLSGAAGMVNGLIDVLNQFQVDVPEGVPLIGGTQFGFSLQHVPVPQIPMLASGGVIRQPTLAMMGEYPGAASDPEIAAPQSAMAQAMSDANGEVVDAVLTAAQQIIDAIRENGGGVVIGDEVIGRAVRRYNSRQAVITGGVV